MISALLVAQARRNYRCMVTKEPTLKHRHVTKPTGIADALTNPGSAKCSTAIALRRYALSLSQALPGQTAGTMPFSQNH